MNAAQQWLSNISLMQQSVLFSAIRGPDGIEKFHKCKSLIRWYRRCVLVSAFDGKALEDPFAQGGGSFTGPFVSSQVKNKEFSLTHVSDSNWEEPFKEAVDDFISSRDQLPYHYTVHFMHAAQILGYKHPNDRIKSFWNTVYKRMVNSLHLFPESMEDMDRRLGDNMEQWSARSDEAAVCSD